MARNSRLFYVKRGDELLHPTKHLFAAQLARECMITCDEGTPDMQVVDEQGNIYPNAF